MKITHRFLFGLLCLFPFALLHAQDKHDFNWLLGYLPNSPNELFGGSLLDFADGSPNIMFYDLAIPMESPVVVSNSVGQFQFYTNGCRIINNQNQVMENGDSINSGYFFNNHCNNNFVGYLSYRGALAIPYPGQTNTYIYMHCRRYQMDTVDVLYTVVDMDANNGLGRVTQKSKILEKGFFYRDYTATRHANGRDWWFMFHRKGKLIFHKYLLDPHGFHGPYVQAMPYENEKDGYIDVSSFSPDGSKCLALSLSIDKLVRVYDFDRCSGLISNEKVLNLLPDTIFYAPSACFSPNSRFVYVTNNLSSVYQFDLEAADINASRVLVGEIDTTWLSVYGLLAGPLAMAAAPDGRIYVTSGNGVHVLHVIESPDLPSLACNYRPQGQALPSHILPLPPNNPNYRLYNLKNSPCDTLGIIPPIEAFWRWNTDTSISASTVRFKDLSYSEPVSWYWDFGDGASSIEQSPAHTYLVVGLYTACLEVCNASGMCDSQCHDIEVLTVHTKSPDVNNLSFDISPNPATTHFTITLPEGIHDAQLSILDLQGRVLREENITGSSQQVSTEGLSNGTYFLRLSGEATGVRKLVVLR